MRHAQKWLGPFIALLALGSCKVGFVGRHQSVTDSGARALSLVGPTGAERGVCVGPYDISGVSSTGELNAAFDPRTRFQISGPGEPEIFLDSTCSSGALSSEIPLSASGDRASFYLKLGSVSTVSVTTSAPGFAPASLLVTVLPGAPASLSIFAPQSIGQYQCVEVVALLLDSSLAVARARHDLVVRLFAIGQPGTFLYSTAACQQPISEISMRAGTSGFSVFLLAPSVGRVSLSFDPRTSGIQEGNWTLSALPGSSPRLVLSSAGGNLGAGSCQLMSVTAVAADGSPLTVRTDVSVGLAATNTNGQFFSNVACTELLPGKQATIPSFSTTGQFFFKATLASPSFTVIGSAAGLISGSYSSAVIAGPPDRIVMNNLPSGAIVVGNCVGPVQLRVQDQYLNDAKATQVTNLTLSATNTGQVVTEFFGPADTLCGAPLGTPSIAPVNLGDSSTQFYFKVSNPARASDPGTTTLEVGSLGLTGTSRGPWVVVNAEGRPDRIEFVPLANTSPVAGQCVSLTLVSVDSSGNPSAQTAGLPLSVSSPVAGSGLYSDGRCDDPITQTTISSGNFQTAFYFAGTLSGVHTVTATEPAAGGGAPLTASLSLSVVTGPPSQLEFVGVPANPVVKTVCSGPVAVKAFDAFKNSARAASALTVGLNATNGGRFFSDNGCLAATTAVTISAGSEVSDGVYFRGNSVGYMNLIATAGSLGAASATVEVLVPPALKLAIEAGSPVDAGQCVPLNIKSLDASTNELAVYDPIGVGLSSTSGNPSLFFLDSDCGQSSSPATVRLDPNTNPATVYFKNTIAENTKVVASSTGLAAAQVEIVVRPRAPSRLAFDSAGTSTIILNNCVGPFSIQVHDEFGNASPFATRTSLAFTQSGVLIEAFSDVNCAETTVELEADKAITGLYVRGTAVGNGTLTATADSVAPASRTWNVLNTAAKVVSISPNQGALAGGTPIIVNGAYFLAGVTVEIGGQRCLQLVRESAGRIRCVTPPGNRGFVNVVVQNPSALANTVVSGFQYIDSPVVAQVVPVSGPIAGGTAITITGSNFPAEVSVGVGSYACANVVFVNSTTLRCTTPPAAVGSADVMVIDTESGEVGRLANGFRYFGPPALADTRPTFGPETGGTDVVITGSSFEPGGSITIGGVACSNAIVTPSLVSCKTGPHAPGIVDIEFTNPDGQIGRLARAFQYLGLPRITQVLPDSGSLLGGDAIGITGENFDSQTIAQLGSSGCNNIRNLSDTFLVCDTPAVAAVGKVGVTITNRTGELFTLPNGFEFTHPPPVVARIVPNSGLSSGGANIEIDGAYFRPGVTVNIGNVPCANLVFHSPARLSCDTRPHAPGVVDVAVLNSPSGSVTVTGGFTYLSVPTVASVTPPSGRISGGTPVVVSGSDFLAGAEVLFAGELCANPRVLSLSSIECTTPAHGAGTVAVSVRNTDRGTASLANGFQYVGPPTLASIAPTRGPASGGTSLTLVGTNFLSGLTVEVGGTLCTQAVVNSDTQVTCTTPQLSSGPAGVRAINPDGQDALLPGAFLVDPPPTLTKIDPTKIPARGGTTLVLTGTHFRAGAGIKIAQTDCASFQWDSATQARCISPPMQPGTYDVTFRNSDGQSAVLASGLVVEPGPALTSIEPVHGPETGGTLVTLSGALFGTGATVKFGALNCLSVVVLSPSKIECRTPSNMPPGPSDVVVVNPDGQISTLSAGFRVDGPPSVTQVSPGSGPAAGGTAVSISGTEFVNGALVKIGAGDCGSPTVVSATEMTCVTPPGSAGAASVYVTNPDGQSGTRVDGFVYKAPPAITSIDPGHGPAIGGNTLVVTGTDFDPAVSMVIGQRPCVSLAWVSGTQLRCVVPALPAGIAEVLVKNPDQQTGVSGYRVDPAPVVTSVTPSNGPSTGNTPVTIAGSGFVDGARVSFGGSVCTNASVSATQITCVTSAHAPGSTDVSVTNPDLQVGTKAGAYLYDAGPVLTEVTPPSGPADGGTLITLKGTYFVSGASVLVGGLNCASINVVSSTQAVCTTPAHSSGTVDVVWINPDTQRSTLKDGYTFDPAPRITSVTPANGPASGKTPLTIQGINFVTGAIVKIDGVDCNATFESAQRLRCVSQAHAPGVVSVDVMNPDKQSFNLYPGFTYDPPPSLVGVTPASGPAVGGTMLTLNGTDFVDGVAVDVGGANCGTVQFDSVTQIRCTTTARAAGIAPVRVTNPDGQFAEKPAAFTYVPAPSIAAVTPNRGPITGNTPVKIAGDLFEPRAVVRIGGTACVTTTFVSISELGCMIASHTAGVFSVEVENPDGQKAVLPYAFTYDPPPAIVSVVPANGPKSGDTRVFINGSNLSRAVSVTIGSASCTALTVLSGTQLSCVTSPHAAGAFDVVVTNVDGQTATLAKGFVYDPPPFIASVSPPQVPSTLATEITVLGSSFVPGLSVSIEALPTVKPCGGVTRVSATELKCTVSGLVAGSYSIRVRNPDLQEGIATNAIVVIAPPTVTAIAPNHGSKTGSTRVTLTGTRFVTGAMVTLGSSVCTQVSVLSATSMECTTSASNAGTVDVVVTNVDRQSGTLASAFTYDPPPTISYLDPINGPSAGATLITIQGSGFFSGLAAKLGTAVCTVEGAVAPTNFKCRTAPRVAGIVSLTVTNPDAQSATLLNAFTYTAPPSILSITPNHGPSNVSTPLAIAGLDFQGGVVVKVGGVTCDKLIFLSGSSLKCDALPHAPGPVGVMVTNPDGQQAISINGFLYDGPPAITLVSPVSGSSLGGTDITIRGGGLVAKPTVDIGGSDCGSVIFDTPDQIRCRTTAHLPGAATVKVTNPDGQSASANNVYYYNFPPSFSSVTPISGPKTIATPIRISGINFAPGVTVKLGGQPCTAVSLIGTTTIDCLTPTSVSVPGPANIDITNADGQSVTVSNRYTFIAPPQITVVTPASGSSLGGELIVIDGSGFSTLVTVKIGNTPCLNPVVTGSTRVQCVSGSHAPGTVDVRVTNSDNQVAVATNKYTYVAPPIVTGVIPISGPAAGGYAVTITGQNFQSGYTSIRLGTVPCANVTVVSAGVSLRCTAGASPPGKVVATVVNPDGQTGTLTNAFEYLPPPEIVAIIPPSGPTAGGVVVTVEGRNFNSSSVVTLGGTACINQRWVSSNRVECKIPVRPAGDHSLQITSVESGSSNLASFKYDTKNYSAIDCSVPAWNSPATSCAGSVVSTGSMNNSDEPGAAELSCEQAGNTAGRCCMFHLYGIGQWYLTDGISQLGGRLCDSAGASQCYAGGVCRSLINEVVPPENSYLLRAYHAVTGDRLYTLSASEIAASPGYVSEGVAFRVFTQNYVGTQPLYRLVSPDKKIHHYTLALTERDSLVAGGWNFEGVTAYVYTQRNGLLEIFRLHNVSTKAYLYTTDTLEKNNFIQNGWVLQSALGFTFGPVPQISLVTPNAGSPQGGTRISVQGEGFVPLTAVKLGGSLCTSPVTVSKNEITCTTPALPAGTVNVEATLPDGQTAILAGAFTFRQPVIGTISPNQQPITGGLSVVISGNGFAGASVKIGDQACVVTASSATSITCTVPVGHALGATPITVTNSDGSAATVSNGFTYTAPTGTFHRVFTTSTTTTGNLGGIAGADLKCLLAAQSAGLSGYWRAILSDSVTNAADRIAVTGPVFTMDTRLVAINKGDLWDGGIVSKINRDERNALIGSGNSLVWTGTNPNGTKDAVSSANTCGDWRSISGGVETGRIDRDGGDWIAIYPTEVGGTNSCANQGALYCMSQPPPAAPTISSINPARGPSTGAMVTTTITGQNFLYGAQAGIGTVPCTSTAYVSPTALTCVTAAQSPGTYSVKVTNPEGTSVTSFAPVLFTYDPPPTVSGVSPALGPNSGGTAIAISGSNFTPPLRSVLIGDVACAGATVVSDYTISCVTSATAVLGAVSVFVTNADGQVGTKSNAYTYQMPGPVISGVSPITGPTGGGTTLTVTGTNFRPGLSADISGAPCVVSGAVTPTSFTCVTGVHAAGATSLTVTNSDGTSRVAANVYLYALPSHPVVNSILPTSGPGAGNTLVTISGDGFEVGSTVVVGDGNCTQVSVMSPTALTCKTGVSRDGLWDVVVTRPNSAQGRGLGFYRFITQPTLSIVTPTIGPSSGGTLLTLAGSGMGYPMAAAVGGVPCVNPTTVSNAPTQSFTCTTGVRSSGLVDVTVTNPSGLSATKSQVFTYTSTPSVTAIAPLSGAVNGVTVITITGGNLSATTVTVGGQVCALNGTPTATQISCTVPAGSAVGAVDVVVTTPGSGAVTVPGGFTYTVPTGDFHRVFTTSSRTTGDLGGLNGADLKCLAVAQAAGLPGFWKAILSDSATNAADRLTITGQIFTMDYRRVAVSKADLFDGAISARIDRDERNALIGSGTPLVWTGTNPNGTKDAVSSANTCGDWRSISGGVETGRIDRDGGDWIAIYPTEVGGANSCANQGALYCMSQPVPPAPTISGFTPAGGPSTTSVLISGSNLTPVSAVKFNGVTGTVTANTATSVTATAPASVTSGPISVTTPGGAVTSSASFSTELPSASVAWQAASFSFPSTTQKQCATGGQLIGYHAGLGKWLGAIVCGAGEMPPGVPQAYKLFIGETQTGTYYEVADYSGHTQDSCEYVNPNFRITNDVTITSGSCSTCAIGGLTDPINTPVWARSRFGEYPKLVNSVYWADLSTKWIYCGVTLAAATPPEPVIISSVTPASGSVVGGAALAITGTGFNGLTRIELGGAVCANPTLVNATRVTCTTAAKEADTVDVTVVTDHGSGTASKAFTYVGPTITTIYPQLGGVSGGGSVEVLGSGFVNGAIILFGNTSCGPRYFSPSALRCQNVPASAAAGTVSITVRNPDGGTATSPNAFTYATSPYISSVTPNRGMINQQVRINVNGANLSPGSTITVGVVACLNPVFYGNQARCDVPASAAAGYRDVVVKNPSGLTYTLANAFRFESTSGAALPCASFTQISVSCGDPNNYEWSALWVPLPSGLILSNGMASTAPTGQLSSRAADANWGICDRAPAPINSAYHAYPPTVLVANTSYRPMTNQNMGSVECPAYFSLFYSPLIVDLNNAGIELTAPRDGVAFDILGEGYRNQISWPQNPLNSRFLVLDRSQNGKIDSVHELFGNNTVGPDGKKASNGFEALAKYDTNSDRVIDYRDAVYGELRLWGDMNGNGITETNELATLDSLEIKLIDLMYTNIHERNDFYGNESLQRSVVMTYSRELRRIYDVWFVPGIQKDEPSLAELEHLQEIRDQAENDELDTPITDRLNLAKAGIDRVPTSEIDTLSKSELLRRPIFINNFDSDRQARTGAALPRVAAPEEPIVKQSRGEEASLEPPAQELRVVIAEQVENVFRSPRTSKMLWLLLIAGAVALALTLAIKRKR